MEDELLPVNVARERYGFTKYKMTTLIKRGIIKAYDNPKDGRSKRVRISAMEAYINTLREAKEKATQ